MLFIRIIKIAITLLLSMYFTHSVNAQKRNANWRFGFNAGLTFTNNTVTNVSNSAITSGEGCAGISDTLGNLCFYTNGFTVWNRQNNVLLNGDSLNGNPSCTQSSLICPKPCDNTRYYYLFTNDSKENNNQTGLCYSEVDMNLNNGLGGITPNKKILSLVAPTSEKLTGTLHSNQRDYWIVTHSRGGNTFYSFQVTSTGVNTTAVVSSVGLQLDTSLVVGQMKLSPNGQKLAIADLGNSVELFDFNASTGIVSNPLVVSDSSAYGIEFSPSNQFLYVSRNNAFRVDQYNLQAPNIPSSKTIIGQTPLQPPGSLQLAPNGKIYLAKTLSTSLGVINFPNLAGSACVFSVNGQLLNGQQAVASLPNFISRYSGNCNGSAAGIETTEAEPALVAFPNPCSDILQIKIPGGREPVLVELINQLGETVYSKQVRENEGVLSLPVGDLPGGIYIATVSRGNLCPVRVRVLVNHTNR